MKKFILLFIISLGVGSFTYASFPVTEPAEELLIEIVEPVMSGNFNWQAIVSVSCLLVGLVLFWPMLIPGLGFGIWSIIGNKNIKWLGWIGMIANAVWLLLVVTWLSYAYGY